MNKRILVELNSTPDKKRPPHSERELLVFLWEANKLSQGQGDVLGACIGYYRSKREVKIDDSNKLGTTLAERVNHFIKIGGHTKVDEFKQQLDPESIRVSSRYQVGLFFDKNVKFDLPLLIQDVYSMDQTWSKKTRPSDEKYSLLVKIWNRETSFKTQELNELCELIRSYMSKNSKVWTGKLQALAKANGMTLK